MCKNMNFRQFEKQPLENPEIHISFFETIHMDF